MKYLVMDTETGGFKGTSLLSTYFAVLDRQFNIVCELEMFVRPENHIYMVTAEALNINKINLIEHEQRAITNREAGTKLFEFLQTFSMDPRNSGEKLLPVGHNVHFDIERIKTDLISEGSWLKFVSYRIIDTGVIGNFLKLQGKIPADISGSLGSYAKFFNVDATNAHDAKADCMITVNVLKGMLSL